MAWVRFERDFDWSVGVSTIAYKEGMEVSVTHTCRDDAVAAGAAVDIPTRSRKGTT